MALYGQSHREEYGRAGLKALVRPHLFTDDVSPIWICIHGLGVIRAVQENKALKKEQWLVPESEWLSIKRKIVAGAETYFRQQTVPQDDPIPSSRLKFAVHTPQGQLKIENFAWLNDDELVFGVNNGSKESRKEIDLYFWQPGSDETPRNIALGTYFWCAGRGTVMYETGQIALEDDVFEYSYRIGPIGDFTEQRLRVKGRPIRPEQVQDWGVRWSRAENPYLRSRFTCQWVKNKRLSEQYHSRWLPLIGRDGFLTFRFDSWKLIGEQSSVRYASNPEKDSEPLPIQWIPVLPKCVNYYDFKNGYFLSPCGIGNKHIRELKVQSCIPYWWLKKVGERMEVEEFCPPADSVTKNNPIKFPSKAGMLRLISERETFHGAKIGGVYLTTQNGTVTKIFDAWINDAQMSPGGCLLALRHGPGNNFNKLGLSVIDVCSVLPLATQ